MKIAHLLLLLLLCIFNVKAQTSLDPPIYLKSGTIRPGRNITNDHLRTFNQKSLVGSKPTFTVLQFEGIPDENAKKELKKSGITLLDYIPDHAWTAIITETQTVSSLQNLSVRALVEITPEQKIDQLLTQPTLPQWAIKQPGTIDVAISFAGIFTSDSIQALLKEQQFEVISSLHQAYRVLVLRIAPDRLMELAGLYFIEYVQAIPPPDEVHNSKSTNNARANILKSTLPSGYDLKGRNVVVGVGDETDPMSHIDFRDRLINRYPTLGGSGHGVHVIGTLGGAGIIQEKHTGFAPKSSIIVQQYSDIFFNASKFYTDFNMRITNNSYGTSVASDDSFRRYDLYSSILDQQAMDMPLLQHVFAAGNSGDANYPASPYYSTNPDLQGFGTILRSYQAAKNIITVGNTDSTGVRRYSSSRGPTADGRLKPDIAAEGVSIMSTLPTNRYGLSTGTSMASPAVSGGLALLHEKYKMLFPASQGPESALMKALICNAAQDIGNAGPDFAFGYGWLNLLRALKMLEAGHYNQGTALANQVKFHDIVVPAQTALLKVMLYWNDPAPSPITANTLVNDLDLEVINGSNVTLPFVANASPAAVNTAAVRGVDRVNNMEQVVISNPTAGDYRINIKGFKVPSGTPQKYVVVYDFIPAGTTLTYPFGGEHMIPGEGFTITWDSYGAATNFNVLFFNGTDWSPLATNLPSEARQFYWTLPGNLSTDEAKIKVVSVLDGAETVSQKFTIIGAPQLTIAPEANQCEGYISTSWNAVPQATGYEAMRLKEGEMKSVALLPAGQTQYSFDGLSKDSTYWVSVRAIINGSPGRRAEAMSRQPNNGDCLGSDFHNDLLMAELITPNGPARALTSTALSAANPIKIRIKNLGTTTVTGNVPVSYKINSQLVNETISNATINGGGGVLDYEFTTKANLSGAGPFNLEVAVSSPNDLKLNNNKISRTIKPLSNPQVNLQSSGPKIEFLDSNEPVVTGQYFNGTTGINGSDRYDFSSNTVGGRLRTFVHQGIAYSGESAFTMDNYTFPYSPSINYLDATFNLAAFNPANDDIRLDFRFNSSGFGSEPGNKVWIRGKDTDSWIQIYDLYKNQEFRGNYKKTESIEINDFLTTNGQTYSASTQIRWGQEGMYQTSSLSTLSGTTVDDIHLYLVKNDVQLISVDSPTVSSCVLNNQTSIRVTVRNSMNTTINSIPIRYRIDGGATISETIPSIGPNTNFSYTFSAKANLSNLKTYSIEVWVALSSDTQADNNTQTISITNAPLISNYPYFQDFEASKGNWFSAGSRSSWEYGTPASPRINRAASGTKAWKTRLSGNYNDEEESYLYSPCLDIRSMSQPTLSFLMALDIESCENNLCDGAYLEYSYDGTVWTGLGQSGEGVNWYNKEYPDHHAWSVPNYGRWHVATIPLPLPPDAINTNLRLRFVMKSDMYGNREGIAIDDIHIYDNTLDVVSTGPPNQSASATVAPGNTWNNFVVNNQIIASINPGSNNLGMTNIQTYLHEGNVRYNDGQYYMNRNFTIKPVSSSFSSPVSVRLFFSDVDAEALINANGCTTCAKPSSILGFGVNRYNNPDRAREDGTIENNNAGSWTFLAPASVIKKPYGKGYFVEFSTQNFSEFWLSPNSMNYNAPLPVTLAYFKAQKSEDNTVLLRWNTSSEANFSRFEIEVARGNEALKLNQFIKLNEISGSGNEHSKVEYTYLDETPFKTGNLYYRLKMIDKDGSFSYSDFRVIIFGNEFAPKLYPNPSPTGLFTLAFQIPDAELISYRLLDITGRVMKESAGVGNGLIKKETLDLRGPGYGPGIYLLETTTSFGKKTFRLVKE